MAADVKSVRFTHRGDVHQAHVAPWADDKPDAPTHVHIQNTAGGVGEIVKTDSARARALAREHAELRELGIESDEEQEKATEARQEQAHEAGWPS
jgi:hypothetical protein